MNDTEDNGNSLESLMEKLEESEKLKNEYLANWQRARADLINYKNEEGQRVEDLAKYVGSEFAINLMPILDNFELALDDKLLKQAKNQELEKIIEGFVNIKKQLQEFLRSCGLEEIKTVGEMLDLNVHEVVGEEKSSNEEKAGIIIKEDRKGYVLQGRVLRPAKVIVAK